MPRRRRQKKSRPKAKKKSNVKLAAIVAIVVLLGVGFYFTNDYSSGIIQPVAMTESKNLTIVATDLEYFEQGTGYFARPADDYGKYPGLILIHEWWGLNDNIKKLSRDFAREGYVVLAVDLYNGQVTNESDVARLFATSVRNDMDGAFANLEAAVNYLEASPYVDNGKLASVGWCFGGGWSYQMAKNDIGVDASVIYYGQFNPEDDLDIMRADILGHFGADDASILVSDVRQFEAKLRTHSGDHQIFIYPNSGHAFANEDSPAYVPASASLAWMRTVDFLQRQFG